MTGRVLVLGNAGLDLRLPLPRLPRPGESLVGGPIDRAPGGKGLNQAVMAARAGARVRFCTALAHDEPGATVATALSREAIDMDVLHPGPPTDVNILIVAPDGENMVVGAGQCADAIPPGDAARFAAAAQPGDLLLLQGNLSAAATEAAVQAGLDSRARVMVNAAPLRWDMRGVCAAASVVVANEIEAQELGLDTLGVALPIVTLGARGCVVAGVAHAGAAAVAVDTTGAGDAFCGVLAAGLAAGMAVADAVARAQRAAAVSVGRPGAFASFPDRA